MRRTKKIAVAKKPITDEYYEEIIRSIPSGPINEIESLGIENKFLTYPPFCEFPDSYLLKNQSEEATYYQAKPLLSIKTWNGRSIMEVFGPDAE